LDISNAAEVFKLTEEHQSKLKDLKNKYAQAGF
jgi:hypothetical protein